MQYLRQNGSVELAAVGVSIAVINQVSRIAIFPLVSITTSFVAEEDTTGRLRTEAQENENLEKGFVINKEMETFLPQSESQCNTQSMSAKSKHERMHIPSASTALVIGSVLGLIQALFLILAAKPILNYMGVHSDSPMIKPALQYLTLRSLGAPALLLSLAVQGIFRGFKDTKTPFYATRFLLMVRVIAVTFCVTIAASLAARQGSTPMAAFQVCLQIGLATSLLADGLAIAGQTILASAFAKKDYESAKTTAFRVLQLGLVLGLLLSVILLVLLHFASGLFTKDVSVLQLISVGIPFVAVTQPINALAFVFDGINYGASDFAYSAYSMVLVAVVSILCLFILSSSIGYVGIWIALSIYMSLRTFAGFLRIGTGMGPWSFLRT
ncbi:hypothetical protein LWI28_022714 [Acer negundo]|uniref:Protein DETOXIFICATION n=1 Tax=Acer negundo TaxID=4023 RepID=A0AAD5NKE9_ACENE|nr:hypothetical protein LWI28_022714 [Acer negundo]